MQHTLNGENVAFRKANTESVCIRVVKISLWRPFTDSSGHINIVDKRSSNFSASNAIIWHFFSTVSFYCGRFPAAINRKKVNPTSSHHKTQISHYFLQKKDAHKHTAIRCLEKRVDGADLKIEPVDHIGKNGAKINNGYNELIKGLLWFNLLVCCAHWRSRFDEPSSESLAISFFFSPNFCVCSAQVFFRRFFFLYPLNLCTVQLVRARCFSSIKKQWWWLWNCEYLRLWSDWAWFAFFSIAQANTLSHCTRSVCDNDHRIAKWFFSSFFFINFFSFA